MGMLAKAGRAVRRSLRSPFPASLPRPPLIVHCCHHKVGTVWFENVLSAVARHFGLRFFSGEQTRLPDGVDVFLQDHSRIDLASLGDVRGSHMIRDPRDVVISAYFHHLRTREPWVLVPRAEYGGRSYQGQLESASREAGIAIEIERCASTVIRDMVEWGRQGHGFLEIRYEELIGAEAAGFRRLFTHYGFAPDAVERSVGIALRFGSDRVKRRSAHIRSGRPGEWREYFSEAHKAAFKGATDDAAARLGYETSSDW
jgi:hypothetical protein